MPRASKNNKGPHHVVTSDTMWLQRVTKPTFLIYRAWISGRCFSVTSDTVRASEVTDSSVVVGFRLRLTGSRVNGPINTGAIWGMSRRVSPAPQIFRYRAQTAGDGRGSGWVNLARSGTFQ